MVDRLNVVLVSRSGLGGNFESMLEEIVGNLAGRPGIDLVLVSPLAEIDDGSTDQLTLLSIGSGAAVLTWTSPDQTLNDLQRIGFKGIRSPHAGDPFSPVQKSPDSMVASEDSASLAEPSTTATGPKVYAMDLRDLSSVSDLITQLDRLRSIQSVKTFSIAGLTMPSKPSENRSNFTPAISPRVAGTAGELQSNPTEKPDKWINQYDTAPRIEDAGLDDLIDQLDEFDV